MRATFPALAGLAGLAALSLGAAAQDAEMPPPPAEQAAPAAKPPRPKPKPRPRPAEKKPVDTPAPAAEAQGRTEAKPENAAPPAAAKAEAPPPSATPFAAPPVACDPGKAVHYEGARNLDLWVSRSGLISVDNPLRPLTPDQTRVLQVVVGAKIATLYGPDLTALRRGASPATLEGVLGGTVRWDETLVSLPDSLNLVAEDGAAIARLAFKACEDAPAAKALPPPKRRPDPMAEAGAPADPGAGKAGAAKPKAAKPAARPGPKLPQGALPQGTLPQGALPDINLPRP
ncbi:hypothetical protein [Methylobacterium organophilum]|uniref:Uncharacterized protein n=1 Tax=Methylobacterium organophilum TaxID=410 RepID=A0ABQ4T5K6_METOR|nr:hypothetical protein [Methylobacterium organophilum]GJE25540.1 hypothetical protein LKMONMHP_0378 [Methylobacterium organophilum]